ncbi:MAG: hypothetical protein HY817_05880 [Candidatus Abawacabacteria bacterium]|nr:hypothetical protein [Candidatus Abawacabacteria bacterium]
MVLKKIALLGILLLPLSGCGKSNTLPVNQAIAWQGTIIENPSRLTNQAPFLLVNTDNETLLAYIQSSEVALADLIDQEGTITGKLENNNSDGVPQITVAAFTPSAALSLEDILFSTIRRENKKAPWHKNWSKESAMIVLQSDTSNGSAQVQITNHDQTFIVKLVRNQESWHIADIESKGYSALESPSTTASGATVR